MKELIEMFALVGAICLWAGAASAATGKSAAFPLDLIEGERVSAGLEELTFSNLWDGDAEATVTIAQDGAAIFTGLTSEGVKTWTVDRNGRYVLTHMTYTNGVAGKVETAVFVVEGKEVPIGELTIDWGQASFVYDGQPKEPVITVKDRETTLTKGTHYFVEYKDNVNVGTAKAIVKGIEPYVGEMTNAFTITKGALPPDAKPDPIDPDLGDPLKPFSGFDYSGVCDGAPHTIKTNELIAAYAAAVGAGMSVSYAAGELGVQPTTGWGAVAPTYTDVGTNVVWYKVSSANYADIVHVAKVALRDPPRVTGVVAQQRYPWNGLVDITVTIQGAAEDVETVNCMFFATNNATMCGVTVEHVTRIGSDVGAGDAWSRRFVWNATADVGAVKIGDVSFTAATKIPFGGVQLWGGGPYWAGQNVGATKPEESGYYFWWGDTVGYRREGGNLIGSDYSAVTWISSQGQRMKNSPFISSACPTRGMTTQQLQDGGLIDSAGNLVAQCDAATVQLGVPWRMPTAGELEELVSNCDTRWIEKNGVHGRLVMGRGAYASKSIFLPAAGYGNGDSLFGFGANGNYCSSTPRPNGPASALYLGFGLNDFYQSYLGRESGQTVRPVRGLEEETVSIVGVTAHLALDCRAGDRVSAGLEELTFSNLWDGDADATVTIAQDGAAIFIGLTGEGVKTWSVNRNGRYELTHTTYTNGLKGKVETAVFVVEGKEVPVGELTVEWDSTDGLVYDGEGKMPGVVAKDGDTLLVKGVDYTVRYEGNTNAGTAKTILTGLPPYVGAVTNEFAIAKRSVELTSGSASKPYDGTALVCHSVTTNGDGFVSGEGVDFAFTGSQTIAGSSKNAFDYTFKPGTLAGNYTISKTEGDLEVTSGEIVNPFDPDDPSKPVTPEVLAKANCITDYDGDGHSIELAAILNPLIAANNPKITYSLLRDGTYEVKNPTFTNVVSTSVWYRIEADNFSLFSTNALLKILPRSIANVDVAAIGDQTYTGSGIEPIPTMTDMRTLIGMSEPTDILTCADYELSYLNNTNVGTAKIVLMGKNNYEGVQMNDFQIVPAIIPPGPTGAIAVTGYTNAYDGAEHGVSVAVAGLLTTPTVQYRSGPSAEWQSDSPTYTDVCDTQVWWKVSAPNYQSVEGTIGLKITQAANAWTVEPAIEGWTYGETAKTPVGAAKFGTVSFVYSPMPVGAAGDYTMTATVAGTANYTGLSKTVGFKISKGALPPGDDPDPLPPGVDPDDPGQREDPDVRFSAFDYVGMYDGEAHTIDTNALKVAYVAKLGAVTVGYSSASNGTYQSDAFLFKDVGVTSFWYKVSSANYADIVKPCKVAITNRPVTLTSGTKTDFIYDGKPHAFTNLTVTAGSFVAGEGIATSNWATVTAVAEGVVPNSFDCAPLDGTKLSNYDLSIVTGKIAVVSPDAVFVTVTGHVSNVVYDGTKKSVSGYDVVSISNPLYTAADFTFTGQSATNGTNAGTYPMGLKTSDFANTNPNFASVVFNVTDGELVISQAANAWTVEPAIEGWTYGETAKTPVGAAKFGEVSFVYSPMPVGAAGDYVMTATVAGTANYTGLSKSVGFKISKGALPPGDDPDPLPPEVDPDDPGQREDPDVRFSAFDYVGMYDGEAHTIDTNALKAAWTEKLGAVTLGYSTASNGAYQSDAFLFKDAVVTSFWYKVTSANYADIVKPCKVVVTNRPVTVTSGTKLDFTYDGKPHAFTNLTVTAGSFVAGEGIATSNWATVTMVAEGQVDNAFDFSPLEGTLLSNYDLSIVTGKIAVVSPDAVIVTVTGHVVNVVYDGTKKSVSGYDVVSISDPLYTAADFTFTGQSATNGTNAGTYPMGLKAADFANTNPNFASVVFNVTDGELVISQAANAWTVEPAIEDWTYGETAKTPVGAATFGEVSFSYSPMPVGAAGDYTMTATVAGTANYTGLSKTVDFTIAKGSLPPGDDPDPTDPSVDPDDPGQKEDPTIPFSVFDYMGMYDGAAHTIDTNALKVAYVAKIGAMTVGYSAASNGTYQSDAFLFKDAVVTSFWYKVTSANYADIVKPCKVVVTNRPVTLTSGTRTDFTYDGKPHAFTNLTVTAGSFVAGEGIATSNWATVTTVAEGQVDNAFDFSPLEGTLLSNYDLSIVTGKIAVVSPNAVVVTVTGHVASVTYDGTKKSVSGYDVVSISDPLYTAADFTFTGQSATNGTNAGTYPMGLKSADFVNTNPNFASVVFNVTDGQLVIAQAANAWTTEPAIEGWTYGETAKTPVGAAKFGEVAFAYSPMPVGAAGDYTMTATVAGTANYTGLSKSVGFKISKGALPPGDDPDPLPPGVDPDDPGQREDPDVRFSAFDYVGMYDGEAHTIDTNALKQAWTAALGAVTLGYSTASNGAYQSDAFLFKDAVVTSFWYKVTSANYADIVKRCKVAITNRPVTVTSGTKLDFIYDGKPHAYTNLTVTAGSFVAGEGIATSNWATVTTVAKGQVPNAFDYVALDGTKLSNYDLTVVTGKIAVVKGPLSPGDDPDPTDPSVDPDDPGQREDPTIPFSAFDYVGMYDGVAHTIDTNALKAAWTEKLGAVTVGYSAAFNGTYQAMAFAFKDVGVTSFWYKVTSVNYADIVKPCKVVVTNRCVTLTSGTKLDFAYDGQPHAFTNLTVTAGCFVAGEGVATSNWATVTAVAEGQVPNAFDYVALDGTKLSNYDLTVITGKIAVVKGPLSPGDDPDPTDPGVDPDDPGQKEDPTIPFSVFDYMDMYDGEAHTIDTNALKAAWTEKLGAVTVGYSAASNGTYQSDAFLFKDAGVTSFWYKVTSANYADIVKPCKVAITNRPVTVTSGTKLDFTYDGKPHAFTNLTVTAGSFVAGEGIATSNWATVTMVAEGQVDNAFDFSPLEGTLLSNYDLSIVTGKIAVVSPDAVIVTVTGHVANVVYDGTKKSVSGYDVVSISDPLYTVVDFTFTGQSATNGTNAGTYPMGLKTSDFANTNPNFASVVFNVTDGELVISQAQNAWTTEPAIEGWTYGETAKTPVGAAKFGEVSFAYSPMPVGAAGDYVMTATVVGTANYTGLSKTVAFTIEKAALPGGGEEPGGGTVPEGGVSKFDTVAMYDGEGHTIKTNELVAAFKATIGNDFAVSYAVGESGGQGLSALPPTDASAWMTVAPDFTNVCETSVWYKVTSANYEDFVHEARVTVMPRDISNVTISDIPDQQHTGGAINPNVVVTDGNPSIISSADYDVGYSDNVNVGTATVTLMGKRNYSGTKMATFKIVSGTAVLQAEIAWKLLKASGTYMAQLKVTCTSGLSTGVTNLRFMFADRVSGGTTYASLWDTPKRAAKSTTVSYSGDTYRYVALDASRITAENVAVTYGVSNLAATSIPTAERTIELYVRKRVNPTTGKEEAAGVDNFVGYLSWTSGGETSYLPIVAGAQAASFSKAALRAPAPMKLAAVNAALAVGSVIAEGSSPYCKLTEFTVGDNEITGVVEVGAVSSDGAEYPGKLGPNATVTLLGTNDLGRDFKVICSVTTDNAGRFRLATPKDCQFFKLKLTVEEVVE